MNINGWWLVSGVDFALFLVFATIGIKRQDSLGRLTKRAEPYLGAAIILFLIFLGIVGNLDH